MKIPQNVNSFEEFINKCKKLIQKNIYIQAFLGYSSFSFEAPNEYFLDCDYSLGAKPGENHEVGTSVHNNLYQRNHKFYIFIY